MSLSWVRAGTPVFYNHSSANEQVPATILGPLQRPGDCLGMRYEVKGTWSPIYVGTLYKVTVTVDFARHILW